MTNDTKARMVTTTAKLLQRKGYNGTGLNQILAESGAPKGSMYFHFTGGKEELAAAAIAASAEYLIASLDRASDEDPQVALDRYITVAGQALVKTGFDRGCPIATVALEMAASSETLAAACADAFDRLIGRVASWLEASGVEPAEARQRAQLIYASLEGALMLAKARRSVKPLDLLRAQLPILLGTA